MCEFLHVNRLPFEAFSGLYYKPMTIVNDYSRVVNKLETSLTDDTRVIIYDHHMFIAQATGVGREEQAMVFQFQVSSTSDLWPVL